MIIWLPLEPLEQRYSAQWAKWFTNQWNGDRIQYRTVNGEKLTEKINVGSVLDAYGTNYWKSTQLANLIALMQRGEVTSKDVLLFADLWSPGIEALQYISCLGGERPKITGILHAGTYDPNDFTYRTQMRPWGHFLEEAWFQIFDLIFVATNYHKNLILQNHNVNPIKIVVTGLPFYPDGITGQRKNILKSPNLVIFPHRLDKEKNPQEFDSLASVFPEMTFQKTATIYLNKDAYYDMIATASVAISLSDQETFGYAMLEATALGCYPLVPDKLSYPEIFPNQFRFQTHQELITKLRAPKNMKEVYDLALEHRAKYTQSITRMTNIIYARFNT